MKGQRILRDDQVSGKSEGGEGIKDKLQLRIFRFGFGVYDDADEYSIQFAGFFFYGGQSLFRNKSGLAEQFQPVFSLFELSPSAVIVFRSLT